MYMPFVIQREERYLVHISYHATSILYTIYKHNSYGFKEFCTSFISPQKSPGSIQWFHATAAGTMKALVTIAAIHEFAREIAFFRFLLVDFWLKGPALQRPTLLPWKVVISSHLGPVPCSVSSQQMWWGVWDPPRKMDGNFEISPSFQSNRSCLKMIQIQTIFFWKKNPNDVLLF